MKKTLEGTGGLMSTSFNPLVLKSDQGRFLLTIPMQYQAEKWREWRNISVKGVDPIPNFPNQHHDYQSYDRQYGELQLRSWELKGFIKMLKKCRPFFLDRS